MTKLSDTQAILLSTAAARDSGSLLPLPTTLKSPPAAIGRSIVALFKRGLVAERPLTGADHDTGDRDAIGSWYITDAGRAAIGVEVQQPLGQAGSAAEPTQAAKPPSKSSTVIGMLERAEGATLAELVQTTGWLPHTTRAALTGLRKKGHSIDKTKRGETTCYSIARAA